MHGKDSVIEMCSGLLQLSCRVCRHPDPRKRRSDIGQDLLAFLMKPPARASVRMTSLVRPFIMQWRRLSWEAIFISTTSISRHVINIPLIIYNIQLRFPMKNALGFMLIALVRFSILVAPVAGLSHPVQAAAVLSLGFSSPFSSPQNSQFKVDIEWIPSEPLNPWAVYVIATTLMYRLAQKRWSEPMNQDARRISEGDRRACIVFTDTSPSRQLTTEYAVRALYQVIKDMADGTPGFFCAKVSILASGLRVGTMLITKPQRPRRPNITRSSDVNSTMASSSSRSSQGYSNPTAISDDPESGEIIDREDTHFRISYQYDGINVPAQDLFFAFFDGIAQTARLDHDAPCDYITAVSASLNFVIHIGGGEDPGMVLTTGHIKRAFWLLIASFYYPRKRFEGVEFSMFLEGKKLANGFMMKFPSASRRNGTGLTAVG